MLCVHLWQNGEARGLGSERGCYGCLQPLEPGAGEAAAEQGVVVRTLDTKRG